MTRPRQVVLVAVLAALLVGLAACGIPRDSVPRDVTATEEPFPLGATTTVALPTPEGGGSLRVFFVGTERLVAATRDTRWSLQQALELLLAGPTDEDLAAGSQTRIPRGTRLLAVRGPDGDGVVTVDLSTEFLEVRGEAQTQAVAQVVFTVTDQGGATAVQVLIEGEAQAVPVENGTTSDPVDRFDYGRFNPADYPEPAAASPPTTVDPAAAPTTDAGTAATTAPAAAAPPTTTAA